jgi:hypothetical protein
MRVGVMVGDASAWDTRPPPAWHRSLARQRQRQAMLLGPPCRRRRGQAEHEEPQGVPAHGRRGRQHQEAGRPLLPALPGSADAAPVQLPPPPPASPPAPAERRPRRPAPQVAAQRLEALENDNEAADTFGLDSDDDEFVVEESDDDGGLHAPRRPGPRPGRAAERRPGPCRRLPARRAGTPLRCCRLRHPAAELTPGAACLPASAAAEPEGFGGKKSKKGKAAKKRKTRGLGGAASRGPKSFAQLLEEVRRLAGAGWLAGCGRSCSVQAAAGAGRLGALPGRAAARQPAALQAGACAPQCAPRLLHCGTAPRAAAAVARGEWHGAVSAVPQAELDRQPPGVPTYLTAAAGPSTAAAARKFCSVCGNSAP